jgi:hypothetical protein
MGWFGKKKDDIESDYVDVEDMPIAIAVMDSSMAAPSAPPASQDSKPQPSTYAVIPQQQPQQQQQQQFQQQQQPMMAQQKLLQPIHQVFSSRIPTMLNPCPFCSQAARTRVRTAPNWATWLSAALLLCVFWPICWIPFVSDSMKQTDHFCTLCHQKVGSVGPFHDCCVKHRY